MAADYYLMINVSVYCHYTFLENEQRAIKGQAGNNTTGICTAFSVLRLIVDFPRDEIVSLVCRNSYADAGFAWQSIIKKEVFSLQRKENDNSGVCKRISGFVEGDGQR
jgi:hypothetical protein